MDNNIKQYFDMQKLYIILSDITNDIYIDKEGKCYFFESKGEADQFVSIIKHTKLDSPQYYKNIANLITKFYYQGISKIEIKMKSRDCFAEIAIKKEDLKPHQYDTHDINFHTMRFWQTQKESELKRLAECKFITPIAIPQRELMEYQEIKYGVLKREAKTYYLIFTSLKEYNEWAKTVLTNYYPLEIDFMKASKIRKKNGLFLNPLSTKLILESELLDSIEKKGKLKL